MAVLEEGQIGRSLKEIEGDLMGLGKFHAREVPC